MKPPNVCGQVHKLPREERSGFLLGWATGQLKSSPNFANVVATAAWESHSLWEAHTASPAAYLVQTLLQEAEEVADHIHVHSQELQAAFMQLQAEEDVQTLEGQVPQQIHCVARDRMGGALVRPVP